MTGASPVYDDIARDLLGALGEAVIATGDVDHFKRFNDSQGHLAGDEALRRIGSSIQSVLLRPADLAARFGGEEIAVLPGAGRDGAAHIAEQIRAAVVELDIQHTLGLDGRLTVSFGAATADDAGGATGLVARADKALYRSKGKGRNRVEHCMGKAAIAA